MNARERWTRFPEVGCIACSLAGRHNFNTEVHHLNEHGMAGKKRRGHLESIPLCAWHHRGVFPTGKSSTWAAAIMGPSLALQSRLFRETYGTDDELLNLTNEKIRGIYGS